MDLLLPTVGLIAVVIVGYAVARRFGLLAPILLVVLGLALSFVPGVPEIHIDPELIIVGVLPPLLYVAAWRTSVPAFRFNLRPILELAIGLALFTAFAVAAVLATVLPGVPFAICLALGAVVAPPDAVAATAVARRVGLPRRVVTVLEGESLFNDATALVLFRTSVAAAIGASVGVSDIALDTLLAAGGGVLIGAVCAVVLEFLHRRITDPLLDNALSLLTPFVVALLAEEVHASGVVAVVVTGLYLGHRAPTLMSAASRLQTEAFWRVIQFLLEGGVFLVVGLQLRQILRDLHTGWGTVALATAAVLGTVIVVRFVWVFPAAYLARLIPGVRRREPHLEPGVPAVVSWAGMRGVVTLATALALPATLADGGQYPRDLFVWLAFAVIVGTLVVQGTTLPLLARRARITPDDPKDDALAEAAVQHAASRAARERLEAHADGAPADVVARLRSLVEHRNNLAWERLGGPDRETPSRAYVRLRRHMIDAEREVFRTARDEGRIPEEVLRRAQHDMDLEESMLNRSEDH